MKSARSKPSHACTHAHACAVSRSCERNSLQGQLQASGRNVRRGSCHTPVGVQLLLGRLQGAQLAQRAHALAHHRALKHDEHEEREQRVVPGSELRVSYLCWVLCALRGLCLGGALKHDEHEERERRVVPGSELCVLRDVCAGRARFDTTSSVC